MTLLLSEAKSYIGKYCSIQWQDREGREQITVSQVYDATYVPLYGGFLVTETDDIRLDRIRAIRLIEERDVVMPSYEKIAA